MIDVFMTPGGNFFAKKGGAAFFARKPRFRSKHFRGGGKFRTLGTRNSPVRLLRSPGRIF